MTRCNWLSAFAAIALLAFLTPARSAWVEAAGKALIINNDLQAARLEAMEDALNQAMLFSGAHIRNIQQLAKGVLTEDRLLLQQQGQVRNIMLLSETREGNWLTIQLRADIMATDSTGCPASHYRKSAAVLQGRLAIREQANIGQLYGLEKKVSQYLYQALKQAGQYTDMREYLAKSLAYQPENALHSDPYQTELIRTAAQQADSQYLIFIRLDDISLQKITQSGWKFWQSQPPLRHFIADITVIDALGQKVLFQNSYHGKAFWEFSLRGAVDINSQAFWQSAYGQRIRQLITQMATDIDSALRCAPMIGQIVRQQDNLLYLNLGQQNGLQTGDKLQLAYWQDTTGALALKRGITQPQDIIVTVTAVDAHNAIAQAPQDLPLYNMQLRDRVLLPLP